MQRNRGDVDFRNVIDADRGGGGNRRHIGGEIGEPAAIQYMIGGEGGDLARRAIDADARAHPERVPLDARLELLIAVEGEPDRTPGEEHPRQRDIERERRVVAAAKSGTEIGELSADMI